MTNPPSPVVRWARNAALESSVMILSGVSSVEMSNEGQTRLRTVSDRNGCPVRERISSLVTNSDQCMFRIRLRHQLSSATIPHSTADKQLPVDVRHHVGRQAGCKVMATFVYPTWPPVAFLDF